MSLQPAERIAARRIEHDPQSRIAGWGQPGTEIDRRMNARHAIAPTLLTGPDGDAEPMIALAFRLARR